MAKELTHDELCVIYQKVFTSPVGQTVVEDLRKSFGDRPSFVPGDPHGTSFREGQRDVYLTILSMLEPRQGNQRKEETD